jgi:hypothetical protein
MSTQNANSVAITGGTISGLSSLSVSGTATATSFSGAGTGLTGTAGSLSIGGNSATTSQTNFSNLTISGSQVLAASNFNSYAPTLTGTGASGTWAINISGTAANATQAANATAVNGASSNGFGNRTVSTSAPAGGSNGDIWYQV